MIQAINLHVRSGRASSDNATKALEVTSFFKHIDSARKETPLARKAQ
jgi:hypothetical protein